MRWPRRGCTQIPEYHAGFFKRTCLVWHHRSRTYLPPVLRWKSVEDFLRVASLGQVLARGSSFIMVCNWRGVCMRESVRYLLTRLYLFVEQEGTWHKRRSRVPESTRVGKQTRMLLCRRTSQVESFFSPFFSVPRCRNVTTFSGSVGLEPVFRVPCLIPPRSSCAAPRDALDSAVGHLPRNDHGAGSRYGFPGGFLFTGICFSCAWQVIGQTLTGVLGCDADLETQHTFLFMRTRRGCDGLAALSQPPHANRPCG